MKSKDLRNVVLRKYEDGDRPSKIFHDLAGVISIRTIWRWIKMIKNTGVIDLATPPGRTRTARTTGNIKKVKQRIMQKKRMSGRKIARQLAVSESSIRRILHEDLGLFPYKIITEPAITEVQKEKRIKFAYWVNNNFRNDDLKTWLFSDEKLFDLDGVYNVQNERIWARNRQEADERGGVKKKHKFPTKVMIWLGVCREGFTTPVILDKGTLNHEKYIKYVLPIALKCGNKMMGSSWTYQQDGATAHTHHLSQQWCAEHLPAFVPKERWPPNSPDLNPFDYSLWNEIVQTMNWERVTTKDTLIDEIRRGIKKVDTEKILRSCDDFPKRLYRLLQNKGSYVR